MSARKWIWPLGQSGNRSGAGQTGQFSPPASKISAILSHGACILVFFCSFWSFFAALAFFMCLWLRVLSHGGAQDGLLVAQTRNFFHRHVLVPDRFSVVFFFCCKIYRSHFSYWHPLWLGQKSKKWCFPRFCSLRIRFWWFLAVLDGFWPKTPFFDQKPSKQRFFFQKNLEKKSLWIFFRVS